MGKAELENNLLTIYSHIITYGKAANNAITESIRDEIETMWNEPGGKIQVDDEIFQIVFKITAAFQPDIDAIEIYENTNPLNNYFRIEEFAHGNISFVDGLGCNSGYFKLENLYKGSTTAAHEYGHTLGSEHPVDLDIRGKGIPGIMYPRGTITDPQYQYNPAAIPGDNTNGGTMSPVHRRVRQEDIEQLRIQKLRFENGKAIIGEFTSVWHPNHADIHTNDYLLPGIFG